MKVAVIGVGRMGILHARLLAAMPDVELVVSDTDGGQANAVGKELGVAAVTDPVMALGLADAAVIATPPDSHASLVSAALERRRPVLCEKPLATSLPEAIRVASEVRSSGVAVQMGFQRRFDPGHVAARQLVAAGRLGRLQLIRLERTEPVAARSPKTDLLRNTAIHDFDIVRWLSGLDVLNVYADGSQRDGQFDRAVDPDSVVITMRLSDGSLASLTVSRLSPYGYDVRAELLGSDDHVLVGWDDRTPVRRIDATQGPPERRWQNWHDRFHDAYRAELEAFLRAAHGREPVSVTVDDGVAAQRVAEAAGRSLRERRPIDLID